MEEQRQHRLAWLACVSCRDRKRKCDRELPRCGLCIRFGRECEYSPLLLEPGHQQQAQFSLNSASSSSASRGNQNIFPLALFLDSTVFKHCGATLLLPPTLQSSVLLSHIGDVEENHRIATRYFDTLHPPLPFISKDRFYSVLLNSPSELRSDVALLILCMKLLMSDPGCANVQPEATEPYRIAKELISDVEIINVLSIPILQSALLIALYEIGHGIYPSAYLTVGLCARYGTALGLDQGLCIFENIPGRWIEKEEQNRAWWTVLLLDRHIHVGCPQLSLCTPDPPFNALLPLEDEEWDQGEWQERGPLRLASIETLKVGRFARVVQAMNLLSMGVRVAAEPDLGKSSTQEHIVQLDRTLKALWNLNATLAELRSTRFCVPHTICVDALIIIHSRLLLERNQDSQTITREQSQSTLASISWQSAVVLSNLLESSQGKTDQYCPLLLSWIYRSAAVSIFLNQVTPCEEYTLRVQTYKQALNMLSKRWLVADTYLHLLDKRQLAMVPLTLSR